METIKFILNDEPVSYKGEGDRTLLWVLRVDFGLTGAKYGCGEGYCGSCTVLVGDEAAKACQLAVSDVAGADVKTIEGLEMNGSLHPLQDAFIKHGALQCGYCTPGMIMQAYSLIKSVPNASEQDIRDAMEGNLCRCGAHGRIIDAVGEAASVLKGGAT